MVRERDQLSLRVDSELPINVLKVSFDGVEGHEELVGNHLRFDPLLGEATDPKLGECQCIRINQLTMPAPVCQPQLLTGFLRQAFGAAVLR